MRLDTMVTNPAALAELTARLAGARLLALDTEFLRESTYRAQLCLLQIADETGPACIDPLAVRELQPLAPVLNAGPPLKVMHACRQDIEVLIPSVGLTHPGFDTQIAAALAGLPAQIGYAELVRRVLGTELDKAHTRTDWSARPLSAEQIAYALDDVRYLLPLKEHLEAELARLGRSAWLAEELQRLGDADSYAVDPQRAWLRVKGLRGLDPARERLAQQLAAWRERRADERNRPRGWILEDALLRDIVVRVPRTAAELAAIPDIPPGLLRHCGAELVRLIEAANLPAALDAMAPRPRPDALKSALVKKLSGIHRHVASELDLSPEVLATRRDLEQLADGERDVAVLQGWRRAILGERLLAAV